MKVQVIQQRFIRLQVTIGTTTAFPYRYYEWFRNNISMQDMEYTKHLINVIDIFYARTKVEDITRCSTVWSTDTCDLYG